MKSVKSLRQEIKFLIDQRLYPLEAIYATCYVFIERLYIFLDRENGRIKVMLKPKEGTRLNQGAVRGEFMNELLNNSLRYLIAKRNKRIKDIIVGEALFFSQSGETLNKLMLGKRI